MAYKSPSKFSYLISFLEWAQIQNIKKNKKITEIQTLLVIQNSSEYNIFNSIIKRLIRTNIFNLSKISYIVILFLSPYIDPHLKYVLENDEDIPIHIIESIYDTDNYTDNNANNNTENYNYSSPQDKTISNILNLVLNQLITMELFLNIHVFILYLNLHNTFNSKGKLINSISTSRNNIFLFKISQMIEIITSKIPKSALSLLIMKIINKLGYLHNNTFNNNEIINLKKDYLDSRITEITNSNNKNNELLDKFIIRIMNICDNKSGTANNASMETDSFKNIWNTSKSHLVDVVKNSIMVFKISLEILIDKLIKEKPELESKASSIINSIMNFLIIEIDELDTKLSV
jgi:hypothetical protein